MGSVTEICVKKGWKKQEIDVLSEFGSYMLRMTKQDRWETMTEKCYRRGCRPHAKSCQTNYQSACGKANTALGSC